jgi:hypothetical protein
MALSVPVPGLRRMVNPSHDVAKVALVVASGAELDVPPAVAAQLEQQGFKDAAPVALTVNVAALDVSPDEAAEAVIDAVKKGKKG